MWNAILFCQNMCSWLLMSWICLWDFNSGWSLWMGQLVKFWKTYCWFYCTCSCRSLWSAWSKWESYDQVGCNKLDTWWICGKNCNLASVMMIVKSLYLCSLKPLRCQDLKDSSFVVYKVQPVLWNYQNATELCISVKFCFVSWKGV